MSIQSPARAMSVEETRTVIEGYIRSGHSDLGAMAADVCFTVMATGQEFRGPDAIAGMLAYFYQQAFEAEAVNERLVVGSGRAVGEWDFVGRHIGEFAGVPATGTEVSVPKLGKPFTERELGQALAAARPPA